MKSKACLKSAVRSDISGVWRKCASQHAIERFLSAVRSHPSYFGFRVPFSRANSRELWTVPLAGCRYRILRGGDMRIYQQLSNFHQESSRISCELPARGRLELPICFACYHPAARCRSVRPVQEEATAMTKKWCSRNWCLRWHV